MGIGSGENHGVIIESINLSTYKDVVKWFGNDVIMFSKHLYGIVDEGDQINGP